MLKQKIFLSCGFHVNCNHSWRGDRNDRTGFGTDLKVIRGIIKILDGAESRGFDVRGTWDFDNHWSLEHVLPRFAPDIIESISRRVKNGLDEVILGCWNNGDVCAATTDMFRESLKRAISNSAGSGVRDLFGKFSPVVRTQETMFTQGDIELYNEQGVEAIALYYSSVPFDAFKNFVSPLKPAEMYNPMHLRSTVSTAKMLVIPMYNQGDIIARGSLRRWVEDIRKKQISGEIPGNALLYINMDADGEVWTGVPLPKFFQKLPNVRGLDEFIDLVDQTEYLEFGHVGEYVKNNPPAGEITIRQDLADGSYCGFNSWTEKEINYRLWRLAERARWFERSADALSSRDGFPPEARDRIARLLREDGDSFFENKIRLLSTTHFGMNSPAVHEDRLRVAFHLSRTAADKARAALDTAVNSDTSLFSNSIPDALLSFNAVEFPKYAEASAAPNGTRSLLRIPVAFDPSMRIEADKIDVRNSSGESIPFDITGVETDGAGALKSGTLLVLYETQGAGGALFLCRSEGGAGIKGKG
ncbi:MAG TPA: hypothetical protein PLQ76_04945, partial [bacterium]|nr:hypothetical protein [bacterium]